MRCRSGLALTHSSRFLQVPLAQHHCSNRPLARLLRHSCWSGPLQAAGGARPGYKHAPATIGSSATGRLPCMCPASLRACSRRPSTPLQAARGTEHGRPYAPAIAGCTAAYSTKHCTPLQAAGGAGHGRPYAPAIAGCTAARHAAPRTAFWAPVDSRNTADRQRRQAGHCSGP